MKIFDQNAATPEEKAAYLDAAWHIERFVETADPAADILVENVEVELAKVGYSTTNRYKEQRRAALRVVLLNLCLASSGTFHYAIQLPAGKQFYASSGGGYAHFIGVRDALQRAALIAIAPGFRSNSHGRNGRIWATEKLASMINTSGVDRLLIRRSDRFPLLRLKTAKKVLIPVPDTATSRVLHDEMERINKAYERSKIVLNVADIYMDTVRAKDGLPLIRLDVTRPFVYRVFNNGSMQEGGRLAGAFYQGIPKRFRKFIRIVSPCGSEPEMTTEIDFSNFHPALAYARLGLPAPEESYAVGSLTEDENRAHRSAFKLAFNIMLNSKSRKSAIGAVRKALEEEGLSGVSISPRELVDLMEEHHAAISEVFYSGLGTHLMFTESNIAVRVILRMLDEGAVALCVHDSFIVQSRFADRLERVMLEEFKRETGQSARVKRDPTECEERKGTLAAAPWIAELAKGQTLADELDVSAEQRLVAEALSGAATVDGRPGQGLFIIEALDITHPLRLALSSKAKAMLEMPLHRDCQRPGLLPELGQRKGSWMQCA